MLLREPVSSGTHLLWFLLAIPATCFLIKFSKNKPTIIVYSISILLCYGASATYHGVHSNIELWLLLDQVCIYLLIAGTYTAIITNIGFIIYIWFLAFSGILLLLLLDKPPDEAYLIVGIMPILSKSAIKFLLKEKTFLIFAGIVFYISGALLSYWGKFSLLSGLIGVHETFHLFVMAGTSVHYYYILKYVVLLRDETVSTATRRKFLTQINAH
jgi:hemolysin III